MSIRQEHLADFKAFAEDHIKEFDAAPCEFEASDGSVYNAAECWQATVSLGLEKRLSWTS